MKGPLLPPEVDEEEADDALAETESGAESELCVLGLAEATVLSVPELSSEELPMLVTD